MPPLTHFIVEAARLPGLALSDTLLLLTVAPLESVLTGPPECDGQTAARPSK